MKKEYDFRKLKELKNPYPAKKEVGITPEPEFPRAIGEHSTRKGTASLCSRQTDAIIRAAWKGKPVRKRRPKN
jgi:hypothetical protein